MRQNSQFWKWDKTANFKVDETADFENETKLYYQSLIETEKPLPKCNFFQFFRLWCPNEGNTELSTQTQNYAYIPSYYKK